MNPTASSSRWPRSDCGRRTFVAGAAGSVVGIVLTGCTTARAGHPLGTRPTPAAANPNILVLRPWYNFPNGTSSTAISLLNHGLEPFVSAHKGVRVRITTLAYQQATVAALLAGTGPDVFEDWVLPPYVRNNLLLDLSPFVTRDNVDLGVFAPAQIAYFQQIGSFSPSGRGLYALPAYIHTKAQAVNLDILDRLDLSYPEPGWTWRQWTQLWQAVTVKSSTPNRSRTGASLPWYGFDSTGGNPAPFYWHGFGGGFVDPHSATRCYLDSPGSVALAEWLFPLLRQGVVGGGNFATGSLVCDALGSAGSLPAAVSGWHGIKWQIFGQPVFPVVPDVNFAASDSYGISAGTKNPDLAWELLKYLTYGTSWQKYMMRLALTGPNQPSLWSEWADTVRAVAPPLKSKNIEIMVHSVARNHLYVRRLFRYANVDMAPVINRYTRLAQTGAMGIVQAFSAAAQQVNQMQLAGASLDAQARRTLLTGQAQRQKALARLPELFRQAH